MNRKYLFDGVDLLGINTHFTLIISPKDFTILDQSGQDITDPHQVKVVMREVRISCKKFVHKVTPVQKMGEVLDVWEQMIDCSYNTYKLTPVQD